MVSNDVAVKTLLPDLIFVNFMFLYAYLNYYLTETNLVSYLKLRITEHALNTKKSTENNYYHNDRFITFFIEHHGIYSQTKHGEH